MEIVTNEVEELEFKRLESPKDENSTDSNTLQQGNLEKLENSSLGGLEMSIKVDTSFEIKSKHSSRKSQIKTNTHVIETNSAQVNSIGKSYVSSLSVTKISSSEMVKQESKSNKIKSNSSYISRDTEIKTSSDFNKIKYSPTHSIVRVKCSSSSVENPVQTHSSRGDHERNIKETYEIFPKSVPSSVNVNPNLITVKFDSVSKSFISAFDKTTTIEEMKKKLNYILELEEDFIVLKNNDTEAQNSQTLADLGGHSESKFVFEVSTKIPEREPMLRAKIEENIPTIEVNTVHVKEKEFYKDIVVVIENESIQKQWLGGYHNKLTGTVYHNADSQTTKKKKVYEINEASGEKIPLFFNRDTQTPFPFVQKAVDTVIDKATQMSRSDLYITSKKDKIMTARPIDISLLNDDEGFIKHILVVQKAVRKWILRRKFVTLINTHIQQLRAFKEERQKIIHDQEDKDRAVITGAAYPVHRDDFYALFLRIEKWWQKEWKRICETKRSEPKKAASVMLIEKETKLLEGIEKHKVASKAESLKKEQMNFLEQISRPMLFRSSKGHLTTIDYLDIQKAREFKEMYSALTRNDVSLVDRIEILITMKQLFESHYMEYEYAKDLVSLINREIELIGIGMKLNDLKGLQSRIEQLFLNFLHQPEFNPSAKKYKKQNLPKTLHQTFQCSRCLKLLPASKYPVHVRMRAFSQCKSCTWMHNIAHQRADMSPYLKLLHQVQNSEMKKCCHSAICFILQPIGMGHLTNVIWHGHSAISECSDVSKLHHVRWLPDVEWAPWNTILLSDQEAKLHESIPNIFTFYDEKFIEKVRQKHILARKRFIPLLMMDHDIRSTGQWSKITDSGVFLHPSHAERMAAENQEYDAL